MSAFRNQDAGRPLLLTVEEAGEVLRVGRTKAYAMAREWRETDGRSGLPVIDLGHVLRVPRRALENMIGAEITDVPSTDADADRGDPAASDGLVGPPAEVRRLDRKPPTSGHSRTPRGRRQATRSDDEQLGRVRHARLDPAQPGDAERMRLIPVDDDDVVLMTWAPREVG